MKRCTIIAALALAALCCIAAAPQVRSIWAQKRKYLHLADLAARYRTPLLYTASGWNFGKLELKPEKRDARYNNVRIVPSFAPLEKNGVPYLSALDVTTLVNPFFTSRKAHKHKIVRIMLDPGHGGKDHGAIGRIAREKNITLLLSRRVKKALESNGYTVLLTRSADNYLALSARAAHANQQNADLFVSLHVNAAADRAVSGIETFALTPAGAPSSTSAKPETTKYPGNAKDFNNILLAYHIQKSLLTATGAADRGVKRARFAVLRDISCPGVLVEIGFISNRQEERKLANAAYQELLARAICSGIIAYHRSLAR